MDEQLFPTRLNRGQDTDVRQPWQIFGGSLAFRDSGFDEIRDAAIGLFEDNVDQLAAVDPTARSSSRAADCSTERLTPLDKLEK
jgi:hypothetical protein